MPLLLFISSQFTYKRFLLFWALTGMLFTHSWLTEPTTPEFFKHFATYSNLGCGLIALICFSISPLVNKTTFRFRLLNFIMMFSSFKHFTRSGFKDGKYSLFTFTSLIILMIDALVLPKYDYESIYWIILAVGTIWLTLSNYSFSALKTANSAF
jgi:hypothetical protein